MKWSRKVPGALVPRRGSISIAKAVVVFICHPPLRYLDSTTITKVTNTITIIICRILMGRETWDSTVVILLASVTASEPNTAAEHTLAQVWNPRPRLTDHISIFMLWLTSRSLHNRTLLHFWPACETEADKFPTAPLFLPLVRFFVRWKWRHSAVGSSDGSFGHGVRIREFILRIRLVQHKYMRSDFQPNGEQPALGFLHTTVQTADVSIDKHTIETFTPLFIFIYYFLTHEVNSSETWAGVV